MPNLLDVGCCRDEQHLCLGNLHVADLDPSKTVSYSVMR